MYCWVAQRALTPSKDSTTGHNTIPLSMESHFQSLYRLGSSRQSKSRYPKSPDTITVSLTESQGQNIAYTNFFKGQVLGPLDLVSGHTLSFPEDACRLQGSYETTARLRAHSRLARSWWQRLKEAARRSYFDPLWTFLKLSKASRHVNLTIFGTHLP